jgi:hypothetical protein
VIISGISPRLLRPRRLISIASKTFRKKFAAAAAYDSLARCPLVCRGIEM